MEDENLPYHKPLEFAVNDRVKVVKKITQAHAWYSDWLTSMDSCVGRTLRIIAVNPEGGFTCGDKQRDITYMYPSCALEPVTNVVIEVRSL